MGSKIILTEGEVKKVLKMYVEDKLGSPTIAKEMGYHKTIILRTLKENNIMVGKSGRRNTGGKTAADKRYTNKPGMKNKLKEYHKEWRSKNGDKIRENHKKWREINKEHVNTYSREYERYRRANDPGYRLKVRTGTSVWMSLKERDIKKQGRTFNILAYSLGDLINHLESLFTDGMNWDNYGKWHVDHIRPISSFNFTSEDDITFKECWALSNLQPLWASDNLSKGKKW